MKSLSLVKTAVLAIFLFANFNMSAADRSVKSSTAVDSGSFGIAVNGRRLATETFRIEQRPEANFISSKLKFNDSSAKAVQSSEMVLTSDGELKKYTWKETEPNKSEIVVEPQDDQFMVVHVTSAEGAKPKDIVHPLSPQTSIMDANFFTHMEVLTWKYMAMSCKPNIGCKWLPLRLPVFVPHEQQSMIVELKYTGDSKMKMNGVISNYKEFSLQADSGDCLLWFNDQNKLVRVLIASDNTEVLRD